MLQNFRLLRSDVNVDPLLAALERKPFLFDQITARQTTPGSPHHDTKAIFLRWCRSQTVEAVFNELPAIDYPALKELPEAVDLIQEVMKLAGSRILGRVLIAELEPQGVIDMHADEGLVADNYERFHVSLQSDEGNWFHSYLPFEKQTTSEVIHMKPGEVWWFNHKREHYLENRSERPRVHLIVDCVSPVYRRERDALSA